MTTSIREFAPKLGLIFALIAFPVAGATATVKWVDHSESKKDCVPADGQFMKRMLSRNPGQFFFHTTTDEGCRPGYVKKTPSP